MIKVLLVLHVFVTIALIGVVLIQRSEGGGLGLGGGQGMGNFMSGRGTANLLTRTTAILGASNDNAASILNAPPPNNPATIPGPAVPGMAQSAPVSLPQIPADVRPGPSAPTSGVPATNQPGVPMPGVPMPATPAPGVPAPAAPGTPKTN
jgi:preprotein translocase subunit SecG